MTDLLQPQPTPPADVSALVLSGVLAAALCLPRAAWRWSGLVVTLIHELGHALAGLVTGRRVMTVRIDADHSGATHSFGTGTSAAWSTFWGYPFPAVAGALWAAASGVGLWPLAAAVSGAVLVLGLAVMRGWLTWGVTLVAAAALLGLAASGLGAGRWLMLAAGTALWAGSLRAWWALARRHVTGMTSRRPRRDHPLGLPSDAVALARATGVPALVWIGLFLLVILLCGLGVIGVWLD